MEAGGGWLRVSVRHLLMQVTVGRILSLVIGLVYLVAAFSADGMANGLKCIVFLVFVSGLIWFPEEIEEVTDFVIGHSG